MTRTLTLTRANWWQELEGADISRDACLVLRGVVNAYLNRVIPPMHDGKLDRLIAEVGEVIELNSEALRLTTDGIRLRLVPLHALPLPIAVSGERIYELVAGSHRMPYGVAIVELRESQPHWHEDTEEVYTLLDGGLNVWIDGHLVRLSSFGASVTIRDTSLELG